MKEVKKLGVEIMLQRDEVQQLSDEVLDERCKNFIKSDFSGIVVEFNPTNSKIKAEYLVMKALEIDYLTYDKELEHAVRAGNPYVIDKSLASPRQKTEAAYMTLWMYEDFINDGELAVKEEEPFRKCMSCGKRKSITEFDSEFYSNWCSSCSSSSFRRAMEMPMKILSQYETFDMNAREDYFIKYSINFSMFDGVDYALIPVISEGNPMPFLFLIKDGDLFKIEDDKITIIPMNEAWDEKIRDREYTYTIGRF